MTRRDDDRRNRSLFIADWQSALMIHFRVAPRVLAGMVPFELDLRDGDAFVSLVAFTQNRLRPAFGGSVVEWLSAPLARHEFLNLRAYVRVENEPAIFFLAEWIPNRLAVAIGPRVYGLPYRLGQLNYRHDLKAEFLHGRISSASRAFEYRARLTSRDFRPADPGSLDHFFMERYVAYTYRGGVARRFDVAHAPWPQVQAEIQLLDLSLIATVLPAEELQLLGANFSPGIADVQISRPQIVMTRRGVAA